MKALHSSSISLVLLCLTACGGQTGTKSSAADQTSPKALAESIFAAARSGDFASLKGIAAADSDGDAKKVAGVADAAAKDQDSFKEYFGPGKVDGEVTIEGEKASVPIKFGPGAQKSETLMMVKTNGSWFLQSF